MKTKRKIWIVFLSSVRRIRSWATHTRCSVHTSATNHWNSKQMMHVLQYYLAQRECNRKLMTISNSLEMDDLRPISGATAHRLRMPMRRCIRVRVAFSHESLLISLSFTIFNPIYLSPKPQTAPNHVHRQMLALCELQRILQIGARHASEWQWAWVFLLPSNWCLRDNRRR